MERSLVANNDGYESGGIVVTGWSATRLAECTITNNGAPQGGGMLVFPQSTATLIRTVLWGNCGGDADDMVLRGAVTFSCCVLDSTGIRGEGHQILGEGNLFQDPLFCEAVSCGARYTGEYLMHEWSPCAPDNNPCGTRIGAVDFCELESVVNPR
jgi:hypothetical protein